MKPALIYLGLGLFAFANARAEFVTCNSSFMQFQGKSKAALAAFEFTPKMNFARQQVSLQNLNGSLIYEGQEGRTQVTWSEDAVETGIQSTGANFEFHDVVGTSSSATSSSQALVMSFSAPKILFQNEKPASFFLNAHAELLEGKAEISLKCELRPLSEE